MAENTYAGPYFKINLPTEVTYNQYTINACTEEGCILHNEDVIGKYCSECGNLLELVTISEEIKNNNLYKLLYEFSEENNILFLVNEDILLPNQCNYKLETYSKFFDSFSEGEEFEIKYINEGIEIFKEFYIDFIKFLYDKKINFEIKYGVITYN